MDTKGRNPTVTVDGIKLRFQLRASGSYEMRYPHFKTGERVKLNLKLSDLACAMEKGEAIYRDFAHKFARGISFNVPTFAEESAAFLADLKHDVVVGTVSQSAYDHAKRRVDSVLPFLGNHALDNIDRERIKALHKWRYEKWENDPRRHPNGGKLNIKEPTSSSQNRLEGIILRVIKHAMPKKLSVNPLEGLDRSVRSNERKGAFSDRNWLLLSTHLTTHVTAARDCWAHSRQSLRGFVHTCCLAGLRVAECYSLQIGDIDLFADICEWQRQGDKLVEVHHDAITLRVLGEEEAATGERLGNKNKEPGSRIGHKRTIHVTSDLRPFLLAVLAAHPGRHNPKAPLWVLADGSRVAEYHHAFGAVLEELGMTRDEDGVSLVLGSLRHTFITSWILAGKSDHEIGHYVDTSPMQIAKHYAHVKRQIGAASMARSCVPMPARDD
jgi:integrase